jgi:predicted ATPase
VLAEFGYDVRFGAADDAGRMRVIYAPNGRGKTNFLRAVNFTLDPSLDSLQALVEIPIRTLSIEFASGASVRLHRESAFDGSFTATAASEDGDEVSVDVDPADFSGRLYRRAWDARSDYTRYSRMVAQFTYGGVLIGDDRLAPGLDELREAARTDQSYAVARKRAVGSVTRLLERVERMLTQSALASLSRESASTGVYAGITRTTLQGTQNLTAAAARNSLEKQIASLLAAGAGHERYGLLSLRQVRDIRSQMNAVRANDRNLPTLHRILTPFLESLQDQAATLQPAQQLIDTFVTAVNKFLDRKDLRFSAATGIELYGHDKTRLQPESLSSGERHLLFLLSHAVLATVGRPLLIIDEPELSLGLEWQRDLLEELLRCSESAEVQFLIASHSVQVMGGLASGEIIKPSED